MNNIGIKQNEPKQLERLAAQRELYSSGKRIFGFQIISIVLLPVVLSFVAVKFRSFRSCIWIYCSDT